MTEHRTEQAEDTTRVVDGEGARMLAEQHGGGHVPEDVIMGALEGWKLQDAIGLVQWARARTDDPEKALRGWAKKRRSAFSCLYVAEESLKGIGRQVENDYLTRRADALYEEMRALEALSYAAPSRTPEAVDVALAERQEGRKTGGYYGDQELYESALDEQRKNAVKSGAIFDRLRERGLAETTPERIWKASIEEYLRVVSDLYEEAEDEERSRRIYAERTPWRPMEMDR